MSDLRTPLKRELEVQVSEEAVQRMWGHIRGRRALAGSSRVTASLRTLALGFVCAVLVGLGFWSWQSRGAAPGPLLERTGHTIARLGPAQMAADLNDGSRIELSDGAQLEVVDNTAHTFVSVLSKGRGLFEVTPGGPRRWVIEAGLASVEVVGTRFSVTRSEQSVAVEVMRGVVLVRSERLVDRVRRVVAGERLVVRAEETAAVPAPVVAPAPSASAPSPLATDAPRGSASGVPSALPSPESSAELEAEAFDALLSDADAKRKSGDVTGAVSLLQRALDRYPSGARGAITAFTLGKLLLDNAGRASDAAAVFARCLSLSPPRALAEDALSRLVEAEARAGHRERAEAAAARYLAAYPNGRRRRDVERWVGSE